MKPCANPVCTQNTYDDMHYCGTCMSYETDKLEAVGKKSPEPESLSIAHKYPKYYKWVGDMTSVDVYAVHKLFDIQDPSGCIQHASKKLLLSGVRTGGKSFYDDIKEARDTLNRWLELHKPN